MTTRETPCPETVFGYLSAVESAEHGFLGGYLLISVRGRPLEFHCTAPVRPSRAQQILYGPTLRPYLMGEQIGGALLGKAELTPQVILTDQVDVLSLRSQASVPLVCLSSRPSLETHDVAPGDTITDSRDGFTYAVAAGFESDRAIAAKLLTSLANHVDLMEPFDRIHEAIREAQRLGERGPEAHGHAA